MQAQQENCPLCWQSVASHFCAVLSHGLYETRGAGSVVCIAQHVPTVVAADHLRSATLTFLEAIAGSPYELSLQLLSLRKSSSSVAQHVIPESALTIMLPL